MLMCMKCGKRMIRRDYFERHMKNHEEEVAPEAQVEPEPVVSEPVVIPDPKITLRFSKPVEVTINGTRYAGKEIEVKDMNIASEIVRICREAYGSDILEGTV